LLKSSSRLTGVPPLLSPFLGGPPPLGLKVTSPLPPAFGVPFSDWLPSLAIPASFPLRLSSSHASRFPLFIEVLSPPSSRSCGCLEHDSPFPRTFGTFLQIPLSSFFLFFWELDLLPHGGLSYAPPLSFKGAPLPFNYVGSPSPFSRPFCRYPSCPYFFSPQKSFGGPDATLESPPPRDHTFLFLICLFLGFLCVIALLCQRDTPRFPFPP